MAANGYRVSFWGDEYILELDSGNGCNFINSLRISHLKGVNFMLYELYLNKIVFKIQRTE